MTKEGFKKRTIELVTESAGLLEKVSKIKETQVRCDGGKYTRDTKVSLTDKKSISKTLDAYKQLLSHWTNHILVNMRKVYQEKKQIIRAKIQAKSPLISQLNTTESRISQ